MIEEKNIVFVTTTLYTKWLKYQSEIIKKLFPESKHIIVDGRSGWPNSWFYWIDEIRKCDQKYYIHIDEDFFITDKNEILKVIEKMESDKIDLIGCSDGYHHFRGANAVALNSLLMFGRVNDIKRLNFDFKSLKFSLASYNKISYFWINDKNIKFKDKYKTDFNYKHEKFGESKFESEHEPYYAFMWAMKEIGCKFDYLFPYFDERFKSTNPRINKDSKDIGIHMWYVRQWNNNMDVWGMPNIDRYNKLEKYLNESKVN